MTNDYRAWSEEKRGPDGLAYNLRYILTSEELDYLQRIGLIGPNVSEIVGMQTACDQITAKLECELMLANGGVIQ